MAGAGAVIAEAGVAPSVPRLPAAAFEPSEPGEPLDPAQLAERIQKNTREAGERLAGQDTGDATRKSQAQALKDLDELLKQAQNPMGGGGGGRTSNRTTSPSKTRAAAPPWAAG